MKRIIASLLLACTDTSLVACATIMHGTTQTVPISSTPSGAAVNVDGLNVGTTPASVDLKRGSEHMIRITMEGYGPFEMQTTKSTSGWVAGNIIFGGIIGLIVDLATGGVYNVRPEVIQGQLARADQSFGTLTEDGLYVILVKEADPNWQLIGKLEPLRQRR